MKRVLHLRTVTGRGGGPEKTILNSPRYIGDGYDMRIAYLRPRNDPDYDLPQRAGDLGIELIDIPERGAIDWSALRQLWRACRAYQPHVVHAHEYKTNILALLLRRSLGAVAVATLHGYGVVNRRLQMYYRIDRWTLPRMDHVIAVSPNLQQRALSLGVSSDRCSLVANAIDGDHYRRRGDSRLLRQPLRLPPDRLLIGAVGRLSEEKGLGYLIDAVHRLLQDGLNAHLLIIGEGEQRELLAQKISRLRCEDRIQLLGHRTDIIDLLQCLDVFALSSLREAFPNAVLEAMAMELPVVATRVAAVPELIEDQVTGLLVEPGNVSQLSSALASLLGDPTLRQRLGHAAHHVVQQRYSFQQRMQRMREIYERVLEARRDKRENKRRPS